MMSGPIFFLGRWRSTKPRLRRHPRRHARSRLRRGYMVAWLVLPRRYSRVQALAIVAREDGQLHWSANQRHRQ
jgi:hypothetical protein